MGVEAAEVELGASPGAGLTVVGVPMTRWQLQNQGIERLLTRIPDLSRIFGGSCVHGASCNKSFMQPLPSEFPYVGASRSQPEPCSV